jgi:geranylgeranyl transferase type-2 subunit alpha
MQHGRRKVAVSQEKLDARAQKALKYKALETTALELRTQHIHDAHSLEVSKKVLSVNPEFYTMWNYRREILIDLFPTWTDLERTQWGESELSFLEFAIRIGSSHFVRLSSGRMSETFIVGTTENSA